MKKMIKKMISMLLVLGLILQLFSPILIVNAENTSEVFDIATEPYEQVDDEAMTVEIDGEYQDDLADVEDDEAEGYESVGYSEDVAIPMRISDIFPDPVLANVIAKDLGLDVDAYISKEDLAAITGLDAAAYENQRIESLEGIQYLLSLEVFLFEGNLVSDLSPLGSLINLVDLALDFNPISDISALENLTNLSILTLIRTDISDISSLANLTNLQFLSLAENRISDLSSLAGLTNLTTLSLTENQITDISHLSNLINLENLCLSENQITDLRPLVNLQLNELTVNLQTLTLPIVELGESTQIEVFLPDGSRVENFKPLNWNTSYFDYTDGNLTWHCAGQNAVFARLEQPIPFSITIHQEVVGSGCLESENFERTPNFQTAIDLMYEFLANNTAENPLMIPVDLTLNEAINALDWGEDITVWLVLSGLDLPSGVMGGGIALILNEEIAENGELFYDDIYWFDTLIYYQHENSQAIRPNLPQMSAVIINNLYIGFGILVLGSTLAYGKFKK